MNTTDTILTGDCLMVLPTFPAGVADFCYFDPMFNIGWKYGGGLNDRRSEDVHLSELQDVLRAVLRVLSPSGTFAVQCGQTIQARIYAMLEELCLHWRNSIIWHCTFGPNQRKKFAPCWQMIHVFAVDTQRFTFNADAVRVPSARQLKYGDLLVVVFVVVVLAVIVGGLFLAVSLLR
jgi:site-specific DNA-methyltransferase (adenine-specific)